jgi:hypothetical protein
MPFLLTEEANAPGLTAVYNELMSEDGSGNTYSLRVPAGFPHTTFGQAQSHFGQALGATVLAVRNTDGRWSSARRGTRRWRRAPRSTTSRGSGSTRRNCPGGERPLTDCRP